MKAEVFTGAAQRVNTDHYYATENNALITAVVFLSMYYRLGMKTTRGGGLGPTESGLSLLNTEKAQKKLFWRGLRLLHQFIHLNVKMCVFFTPT